MCKGRIDQLTADECPYLNIIGMVRVRGGGHGPPFPLTSGAARQVGSIDNDMCGFSMTIGADSAMQRICDACDALITCVR